MSQFYVELRKVNPDPGPSRVWSDVGSAILKFACSNRILADVVVSGIRDRIANRREAALTASDQPSKMAGSEQIGFD